MYIPLGIERHSKSPFVKKYDAARYCGGNVNQWQMRR